MSEILDRFLTSRLLELHPLIEVSIDYVDRMNSGYKSL